METTPQRLIAAGAGALLSVIFAHVPRLRDGYEKLSPVMKRFVMAAALLIASCAYFAAGCFGFLPDGLQLACTSAGIATVAQFFVDAALANQTTFLLVTKKADGTPAQVGDGAKG